MELEVVVDNKSKKNEAEAKIRQVADELGVKIMTEKEITEFAKKIDKNYKEGLYDKKKMSPFNQTKKISSLISKRVRNSKSKGNDFMNMNRITKKHY